MRNFLKGLEAVHLETWDYMYDEKGRTKYLNWDMGIEFENGVIVTYHGTRGDDGETELYLDFRDLLIELEYGKLKE